MASVQPWHGALAYVCVCIMVDMSTSFQTNGTHFALFAVPVGDHRGGVKGPHHAEGEQN